MTKSSLSKNKSKKDFTLPRRILRCLFSYGLLNFTIRNTLGISKQNLDYWLKELKKDGFIKRPRHGYSEITESGKKCLRGLEEQNNKILVRQENLRFKAPILWGTKILIDSLVNPKVSNLNNGVTQYFGIFNSFQTRIMDAPKNPIIEFTCKIKYGNDICELYYEAKTDIQKMLLDVDDGEEVSLGPLEKSMKPEWAIPSPMASSLLNLTGASQIRTTIGTFNRSKGRFADMEVTDLGVAIKILEIPYTLERLEKKINGTIAASYPIYFL